MCIDVVVCRPSSTYFSGDQVDCLDIVVLVDGKGIMGSIQQMLDQEQRCHDMRAVGSQTSLARAIQVVWGVCRAGKGQKHLVLLRSCSVAGATLSIVDAAFLVI